MVMVGAPPQLEASAVEREKGSVSAQTFLEALQGSFQSTWERPEALVQAMSEMSWSEEAKSGLFGLLSYLEALSPCLSRLCGERGGEGEVVTGGQAEGLQSDEAWRGRWG
jgi:hypothetical protein